ncbi:MAG: COX15/CtaA family protein [Fimbriimonadales bacterium]
MRTERGFVRFAVFVLLYNLLVIAWGAFVRLSYSGAGCGSHWPLCNGELLPSLASMETAVEFAHRVSSGLVLPLTIALIVLAWQRFGKGHPATIASWSAFGFTCVSAIVGILLVRFEWVGLDDSVARTVTLAAHLINTMLLLGALTAAIWYGNGRPRLGFSGTAGWLAVVGSLAILVVGISGAVTSLGDTIFPRDSSMQVLEEGLSTTGHFLLRLRIWHPFIAIAAALVLLVGVVVLSRICERDEVRQRGRWLLGIVGAQLALGLISVWLKAPTLLAILHLMVADALWITALTLWLAALESPKRVGDSRASAL